MLRWLRRHCFFTDQSRIAVNGRLMCGGDSLGIASVTRVPNNENHPYAHARLTGAEEGIFVIPESRGPVRGRYVVKVHLLSNQYPPATTGQYTLAQPLVYQCSVDLNESLEKSMVLSIEANELLVSWIAT